MSMTDALRTPRAAFVVACLIGVGVVHMEARAEEFHHDLRHGLMNQPLLAPTGPAAAGALRAEPQGLRITLASKRPHLDPVGVHTRFAVRGDFEITAAYELLKADEPPKGFGSGARLFIQFDSPTKDVASLSRVVRPKEGEAFLAYHVRTGTDGKQQQQSRSGKATSATGRLRVVRTGNRLSYQVADSREEFRELYSTDVGGGDLLGVSLTATTGGERCGADLRWVDLNVRADRLPSQGGPAPPGRTIWWVGMVVAGILLAGTGVAIWRRRRTVGQPTSI